MNTKFSGRTWIEIDLDAIAANYKEALSLCREGARVCCVLKSNAYGHGAVTVARALYEAGCRHFAVSCVREALELRQSGLEGDILVMGLCEKEWLEKAIKGHIVLTVADVKGGQDASTAADALGMKARIHLKVDTGMHRLGFEPEDAEGMLAVCRMVGNQVEGIYSHLALVGSEPDTLQHERLLQAVHALEREGVKNLEIHLCDSIGMVRYPQWQYSRVRTGAMLFGVRPSRTAHMPFQCRRALVFKTTIAQIHHVPKGDTVGYSDDEPMLRDSRIATLCAGYGDGYPRGLSNIAEVEIHGQRAKVCGLVCMDQMMVDITDIPGVQAGDEAVLLGGNITYEEYADWMRSNRNEAITILSRRPLRVYKQGGQIVKIEDQLYKEDM
ncbi:MAG: alanine racemase [Clostridia bacterium]|nr:alanine racemase [Clostridia bacterium]